MESLFSNNFIIRNDLLEIILSRLNSNELDFYDAFILALKNNSVKTFDFLIKNFEKFNDIDPSTLIDYFDDAIKHFHLFNNRYFIEKILDIILPKLDYNSKFEILYSAYSIRYDFIKNKNHQKQIINFQKKLKTDLVDYIIRHPDFKFNELFYENPDISDFYQECNDISNCIKNYAYELGLDTKIILSFLVRLYMVKRNMVIFSKSELKSEVNYNGIDMLVEDVIILKTGYYQKISFKFTKEKEEHLVDIFKKLINQKTYIVEHKFEFIILELLSCLLIDVDLGYSLLSIYNGIKLNPVIEKLINTPNKIILNFLITNIENNLEIIKISDKTMQPNLEKYETDISQLLQCLKGYL